MEQAWPSRRSLSADALRYARDHLWLARGLRSDLADSLASGTWTAWTAAAPSIPAARLERFSEGGAIGSPEIEHEEWSEVARAMTAVQHATWLVPDPLAHPDDAFLDDAAVEYQVVDDAVYYIERTAAIERLTATWQQAASASGQMGLVTAHAVPGAGLDRSDLRDAAKRVVLLAVTAYDGNGIIFCQRTR